MDLWPTKSTRRKHMAENFQPPPHSFINKFKCAFRGIAIGSRGQSSFVVHLAVMLLVIAAGFWFDVTLVEWCLLTLCITGVLALELGNSCIETLARAIDRSYNEQLRDALDIASGAVFIGAIGAAVVGAIVFVPHVLRLFT